MRLRSEMLEHMQWSHSSHTRLRVRIFNKHGSDVLPVTGRIRGETTVRGAVRCNGPVNVQFCVVA